MIKYADYIHLSTGFPSWNVANCINTGIYAAVDCEIRVVYKGTGANTDRIAGFTYNEVGGGAGDSNDFRLLGYAGRGGYDVYSSRFTGFGSTTTNNQEYDYTMYNNYLVDNKTSSIKCSGATQPMNTNCTIRVDVSSIYLNRLEIKNGGVVVFDGYAALDTSSNTVGLYDKISQQMLTNGLSLTYDNIINTFSIDPENATFNYNSGSTTVNITAEGGWTASTLDSWITLSDATGTGESAITVTVPDNYNNSANRVGTVDFTDGEEVLTLTVTQKADTRVILKNLYRSGTSIKQMYRSGVRIYQQVFRLIFNVDTDSITFDNTGGTYTINITANEKWTMTIPNWLNASSLSGTGNASIIISTNSVPESKLEGNIIINCTNKTHTIDVEQKSAGPDLSTPLTFEILSNGELYFQRSSSLYTCYYKYKLNDGEWISKDNNYGGLKICDVVAGDVVQIKYDGTSDYRRFYFSSTCQFKLSGNIMSLITNDYESATTLSTQYVFYQLFQNCTGLTDASKLVLPATTLSSRCYQEMFKGCSSLTTAPELPSTVLEGYCYSGMFSGCTSLTTAPELPTPSLVAMCYNSMFYNCSSLNYIKCLATRINVSTAISNWVNGVSATGTFVKDPNMSSWTTGDSGIPNNWTVLDAS